MLRSTCVLLATACSLVLAQSQPPTLFRSMEKRMVPLHFDDAQAGSLQLGDIDGDGDLDCWATIHGQDRLFRNDGRGVFEDVTFTNMAVESEASPVGVFVDVDGDGDLDFVQGNVGQDRLWRNQGNGVFVDVTATTMPVEQEEPRLLRAGDLDGDGDKDLVVMQSTPSFAYAVRVLSNGGNGVFTATTTTLPTSSSGLCDLELGDLDGDGDLDLIYVDQLGSPSVRCFVNGGSGAFVEATNALFTTLIVQSNDVALADVDGDGDLDLLSANHGLSGGRYYRNGGTGVLIDDTDPVFGATQNRSLLVADWNRDGTLDLLLDNQMVLAGNGAGSFSLLPSPSNDVWMDYYTVPAAVAGDLDGDSDPDLLVAGESTGGFAYPMQYFCRERWFANDGAGALVPTDGEPLPIPDDLVVVADVDLDGLPDIVTHGSQPMRLVRNQGNRRLVVDATALPPWTDVRTVQVADFDGDGLPDLFVGTGVGAAPHGRMLRNTGTGWIDVTATTLPTLAVSCLGADVGDVDGDGDRDLLATNEQGSARLLVNDGTGAFTLAASFVGAAGVALHVRLVDMDADGDLDAVTADAVTVQVFENLGNLQFALRQALGGTSTVTAVRAANLDGDARVDLYVSRFSYAEVAHAGPGWSYTVSPTWGPRASDCEVVDYDGDGDLDIVRTSLYMGGMVLQNDGTGAFSVASTAWAGNRLASSVALGDLDVDGDLDLVVAEAAGRVYWNQAIAMNAVEPADHGRRFRIELKCRPGSLPSPALAAIAFSPNPFLQLVPGLQGLSGLDPNGAVWMGVHTIPSGSGVKNVDLVVANLPALSGLPLWGQAVVFDPATSQLRLTNTTFDVIR